MNNERIKLAEAMGWTNHDVDSVHTWMPPQYSEYHKTFARSEIYLPDPFTDANDDYAVLEWVRTKAQNDQALWHKFVSATQDFPAIGYKVAYQIGDYARDALKVLP